MRRNPFHRRHVESSQRACRLGKVGLLLCLAGLFILWPRPVAAEERTFERWVMPSGSDDNQCIRTTVPPEDEDDETTYAYEACATVARALTVAQPGDIIRIASGVYDEALVIDKPVTLIGGYPPGFGNQIDPPTNPQLYPVQIHASVWIIGRSLTLFDPSFTGEGAMKVTIRGVQMVNSGGVSIYSSGSSTPPRQPNRAEVTLEDVVIQGNSGGIYGGGIDIIGAGNTLRILRSILRDNSTTGDGGGIYVGSGAQLTVDDQTRIQNNRAGGSGGGIAANSALTSTVSGGITITLNTAAHGGGIALVNSRLNVGSNTLIQSNTATTNGGGVFLSGGTPTLSGVIIQSNQSTGGAGGGVYATGGMPRLENLTLTLNTAPTGGGVYFHNLIQGELRSSTLLTNTATTGAGGGFLVTGGSAVSVTSNLLLNNQAQIHGGGGYVSGITRVWVQGNTFTRNHGDRNSDHNGDGGGLYITGSGGVFSGNSYGSNTANLGGGLYVNASGNASFTGEALAENQATAGGGLYLIGNDGTKLSSLTLTENRAGTGGGLVVTGNGTVSLGQPSFVGNTSTGDGAGFYAINSSLVVTGAALLQDNVAGGSGGAGYLGSGASAAFENLDLLTNRATNGGGIVSSGGQITVSLAGSYLGNAATGAGGVFYLAGGAGTLLDSFAQGNEAANGGAVYASGVNLTLGRVDVQGNKAITGSGGGLYLTHATLTVTGTARLGGNEAGQNGGGLYAADSPITFQQGVQLQGNQAKGGRGGGLYATAAPAVTVDLRVASVNENVAASDGGGVFANGVEIKVAATSSFFRNNAQFGMGGGLYVSGQPLNLTNVKLEENNAARLGGGGYLTGAAGVLAGGTLLRANQASGGSGGGFAVVNVPSFIVNGTTFADNTALNDGAGLHTTDSLIVVQGGSSFTGNKAGNSGRGGAIFATGGSTTLTGITLSTNQAGSGGGALYLTGGGTAALTTNTLSQNHGGTGPGGAAYLQLTAATLLTNTIQQNQAGSGGGLYLENTFHADVRGGAILDNVAGGPGGGLYASGSRLSLNRGSVRGNQAGGEGGGAYLIGSRAALTNTLVVRNRLVLSTTYAAGIYAANSELSGVHLTLADNSHQAEQGIPHGVYGPAPVALPGGVPAMTTLHLLNTLVSGHAVGVNLLAGNRAILDTVLWHNTRFDWTGAAAFDVARSKRGDPRFVAAATGDYRLRRDSAAFDQGIVTAVLTDRDGIPRTQSLAPDLGAHEQRYTAGLYLTGSAHPAFVQVGDTVTIQVRVRNQSAQTANNVNLTLVLPPQLPTPTVAPGSCQGNFCTVPLGNLIPGADITVQVNAPVQGTASAAGLVTLQTNVSLVAANFTSTDSSATLRAFLHSCRVARGGTIYPTVQAAVDAAAAGETLRISGTCGDFHQHGGPGQLLTLSKNVTLQGGWNPDFTIYDPVTFPSYLDAGGLGRVVYLPSGVTPTLQTLVLRGGSAAGLGGGPAGKDAGGGLYINGATPTLLAVDVANNSSPDLGGGIYLAHATPTFSGGFIRNNRAGERGGGIYIDQVAPTLRGVTLSGNHARSGGGAYLYRAHVQFQDTAASGAAPTCRIDGNTTTGSPAYLPGPDAGGLPVLWLAPGGGGGLFLDESAAVVHGCGLNGNTARVGGGIYVHNSSATLENSQLTANRAQPGAPVLIGPGGVRDGDGGGLLIDNSDPAGLVVRGLLLGLNTGTRGAALFTRLARPGVLALPHLTIHSNGGGAAVVALGPSELALRDTILAFNTDGPATFAQTGRGGAPATITLLRTLWHPNTQTRSGNAAGSSVLSTTDLTGDPAFRDDGYHLKRISAAYGMGAADPGFADRDGHVRPIGSHAELGADEYATAITVRYVAPGGPGGAPCTDFRSPCPTLQTALDAAADGDLIKMAGGSYSGVNQSGGTVQYARITKRVTIQGGYYPRTDDNSVTDGDYTIHDWEDPHPVENPTVIDVAKQGRVFYITGPVSPTLAYLTLRGGTAEGLGGGPAGSSGGAGGAIYIDGASPTFHDVVVEESLADFGAGFYLRHAGGVYTGVTVEKNGSNLVLGRGGGFYIEGGAPALQNLTIRNNVAITGAGLYLHNSAATLVQNSVTLNGSEATVDGGGLYAIGGAPTFITNTLASNRSRRGGGARLDHSAALFRGNTLSANRAGATPAPTGQVDALGAGLYVAGGAPRIVGNQFLNNVAAHPALAYGGGLYLDGSAAHIQGNTWTGNQAHRGAGLYAAGTVSATLTLNSFNANVAQAPTADLRGGGGAIFLAHTAITLSHNSLVQNEARFGGGVYLLGGGGTVYSNTVTSNRATQDGGGFYLDGSRATLIDNRIEANRTVEGSGGGIFARGGQAAISANLIRANQATLGGGGLYLDHDGSTLAPQRIQANQAADGGGIYVNGPIPAAAQVPPFLDALDLRDNIATNHGGGLYAANSGLQFRRSSVQGNQAGANGGGVYLVGVTPTGFSGNVIRQNTAGNAGGGLFVGRGSTGRFASNAVVNNQGGRGGGILVEGAQPVLVHTTLAHNSTGLVVIAGGPLAASVILTNTLIAGHALGVQADTSAAVTLFQTLWDGNGANFAGPGEVITHGDITGSAALAADGYHLTAASAAIGRGLVGEVTDGSDIDGDGRFQGNGPELGADELVASCAAILAGNPNNIYTSLQQAVDIAPANGEVRAAGTCAGATTRGGTSQLLYIDKPLTVRGGFSLGNWETPAPATQPTVLDARSQGRVVRVATGVQVTLIGLTMINGSAAGQGGGPNGVDAGGAFFADAAQVTLNAVTILNSQAAVGGGVYLAATTAQIIHSTLRGNVAAQDGGALYLRNAPTSVEVRSSHFRANRGRDGGAIYVAGGAPLIQSNEFYANQAVGAAGLEAGGRGGALYLAGSQAALNRNRLEGNRAVMGGALYLAGGAPNPTNNLLIANMATVEGGALYSIDSALHLRHNTLSANSTVHSGGSAILFAQPAAARPISMTNNIVVNHTRAISVAVNNTLLLRANLWFNNAANVDGPGTRVEGAGNVTLDPGFVDAAAGNYQLRANSAAVDRGINAGVFDDLTGQPRPARQGFDIGADEYLLPQINVTLTPLPDPVAAGGQQTYRIQVINTGDVDLVAVVRLTLPGQLTPQGPVEFTNVAIARGAVWTQLVAAAVAPGYTGALTAAVAVTSDQGAGANVQVTSAAATLAAEILRFVGESVPNPALPGTPVELRMRLTNAGGIPLQMRVEAKLPPGLTTTGPTVFTPALQGPDGAWSSQINAVVGPEVSAGDGARPNTLITTFVITSDQGVGGVYTVTTEIARPRLAVSRVPLPQPAVAGEPLVYAVTMTNTGNVPLAATLTNTFPAQVAVHTLADAQPWNMELAPGDVYRRSVSTTVEAGYTGALVGSVRVTTEQGVSAAGQDQVAAVPPALLPTATAKGGDWFAAASWEPPVVPAPGDIVLIPNGVTIFTTRPILVAGLIHRGVLELDSPLLASQTLTVTGMLHNEGEILGADATRSGAPGVTVNLVVGTLVNAGRIEAGDGAVHGGAGGDLTVIAGATTNTGILRGGRGADVTDPTAAIPGGPGGDLYLTFNPGLFTNRGQVLAGDGGSSHPEAVPPQPGGAGGDITLTATAAARLDHSEVQAGLGGQGSRGAAAGATGSVVVGAPDIQSAATRFGQGPVVLNRAGTPDISFTALTPVVVTVSLETGVANFNVRVFNRSAQSDSYIVVPQATPAGWAVNNLPATLTLPAYRSHTLPVSLTLPVQEPGGAADQPFAIVITSQRNAGVQVILPLNILLVKAGSYRLHLPNVQQ